VFRPVWLHAGEALSNNASAVKVIQGLAWTMTTSIGVRGLQVVGTLLLTHLLMPDIMGEVVNAAILTMTINRFAMVGVPNYIITRQKLDEGLVWHGTVAVFIIGVALIALSFAAGPWLGPLLVTWLKSPNLVRYIPGLLLSAMMFRMAVIPERLLQRDMKFRTVSLVRAVSETSYTVSSLAFAYAGAGGMAIVYANITRTALALLLMAREVRTADWLKPHPLRRETFRAMFAFGVPLSLAILLAYASRSWDNLAISAIFGATVVGMYNLAYNLADIPATQVGEQIIDVLTPSMSQMDGEARKDELVRSTALSALVVFPLAVGLGAISETLVRSLLSEKWAGVGPMLTILSALAVVRPIGWTIGMYLQATDRTNANLWLGSLHVIALFGSIAAFGLTLGPLWACVGVGASFALHAAASVWYVGHHDGIGARRFAKGFFLPLLSCVPMVGAVLGVRYGLAALGFWVRGVNLALEFVAGALSYVLAALTIGRPISRELISLVGEAMRKRKGKRSAPSAA